MSVDALGWALREAPVNAKGDLLVLIVLADHAHPDGSHAFPSVPTIARLARMSPRGAQNALRNLERAGLIRATPRVGRTTEYRLAVTPADAAGVQTVRPAASDRGGRTQRPKPPQPVRPNRKNRHLTGDDLSVYDRGVIES